MRTIECRGLTAYGFQISLLLVLLTALPSDPAAAASCGGAQATTIDASRATEETDPHRAERHDMVDVQIKGRDVSDPRVLHALATVPRHLFVPPESREAAHADRPLPIGEGQTISQPYIVAKMTELAQVAVGDKVLEVGTGSGYQAAVLAELGAEVYSIEIVEALARQAAKNLKETGYLDRVHLRTGDGYAGWPEAAPFDAVVVTAAPREVPEPLVDQLKVGGRLVIPVGPPAGAYSHQDLLVITKTDDGVTRKKILRVAFVPMTGRAQDTDE
jgi:protein-L-isoaspartate(D-aspartate) O-methyltransferase